IHSKTARGSSPASRNFCGCSIPPVELGFKDDACRFSDLTAYCSPVKSNPPALSALGRRTAAPPISWLMQLTLSKPRLISLAAGFTDAASLPLGGIRRLLAQTLSPQTAG